MLTIVNPGVVFICRWGCFLLERLKNATAHVWAHGVTLRFVTCVLPRWFAGYL